MKEIDVLELKSWRDNNTAHQLVDIREVYEYEAGNLGGEHIPMGCQYYYSRTQAGACQ